MKRVGVSKFEIFFSAFTIKNQLNALLLQF